MPGCFRPSLLSYGYRGKAAGTWSWPHISI